MVEKRTNKSTDKIKSEEKKVEEKVDVTHSTPLESSSDTIEIPVGKMLNSVRTNPWLITSAVLGLAVIALIIILAVGGNGISGNAVAGTVSEKVAGDNLVSFINAQGSGSATLVSTVKEGSLYKIIVNYQGEDIPVYVTLDGDYLVSDRIPLSAQPGQNGTSPPPSNERVEVTVGNSPTLGNKTASVTLVEFSDYQCPFCRKFWQDTYSQLKKDYIDTGKVKIVFKDFPLDFHPGAIPYAEAARCAREVGGDAAYWKMHDKLFEEQNKLDGGSVQSTVTYVGDETLKKWAKDLGYTIDSCLSSGKYKNDIQVDLAYGQSVGVSGTPGFFINGQIIEGAQPYSVFKQMIDAELAASA